MCDRGRTGSLIHARWGSRRCGICGAGRMHCLPWRNLDILHSHKGCVWSSMSGLRLGSDCSCPCCRASAPRSGNSESGHWRSRQSRSCVCRKRPFLGVETYGSHRRRRVDDRCTWSSHGLAVCNYRPSRNGVNRRLYLACDISGSS